jgi:8-amino-7-oxononanoate synthase
LGFFSAIPQRNEIVLYDELIHASIRDGIRLGNAKSFSFKHNDLSDLLRIRKNNPDAFVFVVVEGIYSMDGDEAPLNNLFQLADEHDFYLVVDEAHSLGLTGERGLGLSFAYAHNPRLIARILTFGKAIGAHGAAMLGSADLVDFLISTCRPFIYTTALDPEQPARVMQQLNFAMNFDEGRAALIELSIYFQQKFELEQVSHIQPLPVSGIEKIKSLAELAKTQGIAIKGVWAPTVPFGRERFRISLHSYNTTREVDQLSNLLDQMFHE